MGMRPCLGRMRRCAVASIALLGPALLPRPGAALQVAQTGRIIGRVVEADGKAPVRGAELRIRGTDLLRVSDRSGRFGFDAVPEGMRVLEAAHPSYRVRTDSIRVVAGETLEIELGLSPDPFPLEPMRITVRSRVLEANGFYSRRDQGLSGTFFARDQIQERNLFRFTDLFASIPGVRLAHREGVGGPVVVFPRGNLMEGQTCFPDIWVDGILTNTVDLDAFSPDHVEGVEVYQGAGTPLRYNSACGAILIWTHVPLNRRGTPLIAEEPAATSSTTSRPGCERSSGSNARPPRHGAAAPSTGAANGARAGSGKDS